LQADGISLEKREMVRGPREVWRMQEEEGGGSRE
jgi:hypothetical protein